VSLRICPEVIDYFKSTGDGWQSRIDETLRQAVKRKATKRKATKRKAAVPPRRRRREGIASS
jgi:uncharacterized protein YdaU (DUF1376 family)